MEEGCERTGRVEKEGMRERGRMYLFHVFAVYHDLAGGRVVEALKEGEDGGLAAATVRVEKIMREVTKMMKRNK